MITDVISAHPAFEMSGVGESDSLRVLTESSNGIATITTTIANAPAAEQANSVQKFQNGNVNASTSYATAMQTAVSDNDVVRFP
jgi:Tfp pilus assembly major pilin PilA